MTNDQSSTEVRSQVYINGAWRPSAGAGLIDVINPATERVFAQISAGDASDVDAAVAAATAAQPGWAALSGDERGDWLAKIAAELESEFPDLAAAAAQDVGMAIDMAGPTQIGDPLFNFTNFAAIARTLDADGAVVGPSKVVEEPVGVVGCITPWNFPLFQISLMVGEALAAGCTAHL